MVFFSVGMLICTHSSYHEIASIILLAFKFKNWVSANHVHMNSDCLISKTKCILAFTYIPYHKNIRLLHVHNAFLSKTLLYPSQTWALFNSYIESTFSQPCLHVKITWGSWKIWMLGFNINSIKSMCVGMGPTICFKSLPHSSNVQWGLRTCD